MPVDERPALGDLQRLLGVGVFDEWVVLLEAASTSGDSLALEEVLALLNELDPTASGLYSPERYAVQLKVDAADRGDALNVALRRWAQSLERLALPEWEVARAEVLTVAELDRELGQRREAYVAASSDAVPASPEDALADELLQRAFCDPLTGLGTWETFCTRIECAIGAAHPEQMQAVAFLEIDEFGSLVRRFGREAGDHILRTVARRLVAGVRATDTIARIGDGGFALFIADCCQPAANALSARVRAAVQSPFVLDGEVVTLTAPIGIAVRQPDDGPALLLERAGAALSAAKQTRNDAAVTHGIGPKLLPRHETAPYRSIRATACSYGGDSQKGKRRGWWKRQP